MRILGLMLAGLVAVNVAADDYDTSLEWQAYAEGEHDQLRDYIIQGSDDIAAVLASRQTALDRYNTIRVIYGRDYQTELLLDSASANLVYATGHLNDAEVDRQAAHTDYQAGTSKHNAAEYNAAILLFIDSMNHSSDGNDHMADCSLAIDDADADILSAEFIMDMIVGGYTQTQPPPPGWPLPQ